MKICHLLAVIAVACVACASVSHAPLRNPGEDDGLSTPLVLPGESMAEPMNPVGLPCQDDDGRIECRRSLHHYDEFERSTQGEIYGADQPHYSN